MPDLENEHARLEAYRLAVTQLTAGKDGGVPDLEIQLQMSRLYRQHFPERIKEPEHEA